MKHLIFLFLFSPTFLQGQQLNEYAGKYGQKDSGYFNIQESEGQLFLATDHYGNLGLAKLKGDRFQLKRVNPAAFIDFVRDSMGRVTQVRIDQKGQFNWVRVEDSAGEKGQPRAGLAGYAGKYRQDIDISNFLSVSVEGDHLKTGEKELWKAGGDRFRVRDTVHKEVYEFKRDKTGAFGILVTSTEGPQFFTRLGESGVVVADPGFNRIPDHWTRRDSLRGMLTAVRSCYDVLFYGLTVKVQPENKSIVGNALIRFRAMSSFSRMQIDLFANMKIEKIIFHNQEVTYTREYNAVFIGLPAVITQGAEDSITVWYSGVPQPPNMDNLSGGWFWFQDRKGKLWIESVSQGSGASLWWPCKDHLSDKPDSMRISVTAPDGFTEISNGQLLGKTILPDNQVRWDWYVSYPINTYDVAVNIGDYVHFSDVYTREDGSKLKLNYYCLSYNEAIARRLFTQVKPMLALYERRFGPYPFQRDAYCLLESVYAMEHQSAVTFGMINSPATTSSYDSTELLRTIWHESSHEWWGNSVTCRDMADLWIHESFATYSEVLCYEAFNGKEAALKYMKSEAPGNKKPIIGTYNVNDFHLGDMYMKGALLLNTLRNVVNNDSLWFSTLRGLQDKFRYQTVDSKAVIDYFNTATGKNYTAVFDQYLKHPRIPQLCLRPRQEGDDLQVEYRWDTDVTGFDMPVRVSGSGGGWELIYPTNEWKTARILKTRKKNFEVDRDGFYIGLKMEAPR